MTEYSKYLRDAGMFPILDAAAYLWFNRRKIKTAKNANQPQVGEHIDPTDMYAIQKLLSEAENEIQMEREHAKEDPLRCWLEITHPRSSDVEIAAAIEAAVKLEIDTDKYCSNAYDNFKGDTKKILNQIFSDNNSFGKKIRVIVSNKVAHRMYM